MKKMIIVIIAVVICYAGFCFMDYRGHLIETQVKHEIRTVLSITESSLTFDVIDTMSDENAVKELERIFFEVRNSALMLSPFSRLRLQALFSDIERLRLDMNEWSELDHDERVSLGRRFVRLRNALLE